MANTGVARIISGLGRWEQELRDQLESRLVVIALELEAEAKASHPYTDRTGANTASIQGYVQRVTDTEIAAALTANTPYSTILEKGHGGRFAYLWPVIERNKDTILQRLKK